MDFLLGLTVGASAVLAWLATYHYDDGTHDHRTI